MNPDRLEWLLRRPAVLGTALLAAAAPVAGCRYPGRAAQEPGGVAVTDMSGYLEFIARQRDQNQESKVSTSRQDSSETILEERFKLKVDGYVYHPNLLEFTLGGLFGLLQHDFEESFDDRRRTSGDNGTVQEFDLRARFFQKKPYPLTLFGRRYQALEPRPFQPSLQVTTTNYGFVGQYISTTTPMTLQFTDTEVLLDPLGGREESGRQRNTNLRYEAEYKASEQSVFSLKYNYDSVEERPFELQYDIDELTLGHTYSFGRRRQHVLESELNYFDQRGSFDIERLRWREILRLSHSDSLRSWYRLEVTDRTQGNLAGVPPIDEQALFLGATVEHQLYESLVTQLHGFINNQDFKTGPSIDRYGAVVSLDYRKNNPWGVLRGNYRARIQTEKRTGAGQVVEIIDERRTFNDPEPVVLIVDNIIPGSIFVTAEDRFTVYQIGRDYTVLLRADRAELRRVPTGRIADGELVLIDYLFELGGDFTLDTVDQQIGVRQDFPSGLSPYYRFRHQNQDLSPIDATGAVPDDITAHLVGVLFERWSFRLTAEYEDFDSTVNPFRAVRLGADYTHRFKSGATAILKSRWTDVSYRLPFTRDTTFLTMEGRYRHPLTEHLTVEGALAYRTEDDSISGDDEGIDIDLSLEWLYRQTELRITYEYGQFEDDFARNDNSALFVQIRRNF